MWLVQTNCWEDNVMASPDFHVHIASLWPRSLTGVFDCYYKWLPLTAQVLGCRWLWHILYLLSCVSLTHVCCPTFATLMWNWEFPLSSRTHNGISHVPQNAITAIIYLLRYPNTLKPDVARASRTKMVLTSDATNKSVPASPLKLKIQNMYLKCKRLANRTFAVNINCIITK